MGLYCNMQQSVAVLRNIWLCLNGKVWTQHDNTNKMTTLASACSNQLLAESVNVTTAEYGQSLLSSTLLPLIRERETGTTSISTKD